MVLSYLTLSDRIIGPIWSNWLHWIKDNFIFIPSVNRHSVESWDLADSASHTGNYDWLQQILWPLIGLPVIPGETNGLRWCAPAMSACRTRCDLRSLPSRTNPNFQLTADLIPLQSVDGGYDQSKKWEVGRSDLSKTERSEPPTSLFLRGRPLLAPNSKTISQNHIKFGVIFWTIRWLIFK